MTIIRNTLGPVPESVVYRGEDASMRRHEQQDNGQRGSDGKRKTRGDMM